MNPIDLGPSAFFVVVAIGGLAGFASMWLFLRLTNAAALRLSINHILAHLLEFQLFSDEPALILRAQSRLILANLRFLRIVAVPSLALLIPFALLLFIADGFFSHAPLPLDRAAVLTLESKGASPTPPTATLSLPAGIAIETPPVRAANPTTHQWQISWRIRPTAAISGQVRIQDNARTLTQRISARAGLQWLSGHSNIAITYPPATILHAHWLIWFFLASAIGSTLFVVSK